MASIYSQITSRIKDAMRARDKVRLATLRDVKSKFILEQTKTGDTGDLDDSIAIKLISKLQRQRLDTAEIYRRQEREDLAEEEMAQAKVLDEFLPKAMTEDEIESKVKEIISNLGAEGMGDMGRVMGAASAAMAGKADGKVISGFVRNQLLK